VRIEWSLPVLPAPPEGATAFVLGFRRDQWFLTFSAVVVLFGACFSIQPTLIRTNGEALFIEDAQLYRDAASMFATGGFWHDDERCDIHARARMPAYPAILMLCAWISQSTGIGVGYCALAINALCILIAVWCLHAIVAHATQDRRLAFAAGAAFVLSPGLAPYALAPMPEALMLALCAGAVWFLARTRKWRDGVFAGLLAGLGVLAKPIALPLAGLAGVAVLLRDGFRHPRRALAFGGAVWCVVGVWMWRNWLVWDCVTLTPNGGSHAYHFIRPQLLEELGQDRGVVHPLTLGVNESRAPTTEAEWLARFGFPHENLGKRHQLLGRLAWEDFREHPGTMLYLAVTRHPRLYLGTGTQAMYALSSGTLLESRPGDLLWLWRSGWWLYQGATWLMLASLYVLAVRGVWLGMRKAHLRPILTASLAALATMAVLIGPFGHTRYRVPMMPFFAVLAGVGTTVVVPAAARRRPTPRTIPATKSAEAVPVG
jgi:hypothetical protein